jgi:hypothetical protein
LFGRIQVTREPEYVYPPSVTDSELDELEGVLGTPLPRAYREFMTKFGAGGLGRAGLLSPVQPVGNNGAFQTVAWKTLELRKHFHLYPHLYSNRDWLSGVVYFAEAASGGDYVWDSAAASRSTRGDYRYYQVPQLQDDNPVPFGESFPDFLTRLVAEQGSTASHGDRRQSQDTIKFSPYFLRRKQPPIGGDLKRWLAFNTNTVRDLARAIRDEGRTEAFPVLADALEEAGCDNADLLDSCRRGDPDIDGVWVLRVLLGDT